MLQLVSLTTYTLNDNWQFRNFMILIHIFVIDFLRKNVALGQSDLLKYGRPNVWIKHSQHVIHVMLLPVKGIFFILSGKTTVKDCLLCLETKGYLRLRPSFILLHEKPSSVSTSVFAVISESHIKKPLLHSCKFIVTCLTGKNKSVLSLSPCLGFRH